ncbi:MAG: tagatose 3-epimerase [Porticoccaceae bacterium]|nr:MAG: tagatose 3-epimerase [Porticoccaceae bacterium]
MALPGVGVNAWVWTSPFDRGAVSLIARAHALGFDAFTLTLEAPELVDVAAVRAVLADHPLRLYASGAFTPERDLTAADPALRARALDYLDRCLDLAAELGARLLVGPAYAATGKARRIPEAERKREWALAVEGLARAGEWAERRGLGLAVEPLNRYETDLVNTAAQAVRLVEAVGSPAVGIHLDTYHMHIEEKSLAEAVRLAGSRLWYLDASECDRGAPGSGQVHWDELARALRAVDYRGDLVIESFTPDCQALAAAAAIWRPLADGPDALAAEGLVFLRRLLARHFAEVP